MSFTTPMIDELFQTIANGDRPRLAELLRNNPELATVRNESGDSPLLFAAYRGRQELVDLLVECGVEPDIYEATTLGDSGRVAALLKEDPKRLNARSHDGWTPLHLAAFFGRREVAELLLEAGAEVNAASSPCSLAPGNTPLHTACASGNFDIAALLLDEGADPDAAQENGMTPLHVAAAGTNPALVQLLLDHKAGPGLEDNEGRTPLVIAQQLERHDLANVIASYINANGQ